MSLSLWVKMMKVENRVMEIMTSEKTVNVGTFPTLVFHCFRRKATRWIFLFSTISVPFSVSFTTPAIPLCGVSLVISQWKVIETLGLFATCCTAPRTRSTPAGRT